MHAALTFSGLLVPCCIAPHTWVHLLQQVRGGHTLLAHITAPQSDFGGDGSKTDALHAMELSLSFEKLNFQKLKELQAIAVKNSDAQMADFVEDMLQEQVCLLPPVNPSVNPSACISLSFACPVHMFCCQLHALWDTLLTDVESLKWLVSLHSLYVSHGDASRKQALVAAQYLMLCTVAIYLPMHGVKVVQPCVSVCG